MNYEEKARLTQYGNWSEPAVAARLRAALQLTGKQQREIAEAIGVKTTTLNTQFVKGRPKIELLAHFNNSYRIDFNFIQIGAFVQLPADVQDQLVAALAAQQSP